jgi:hypothetical protein
VVTQIGLTGIPISQPSIFSLSRQMGWAQFASTVLLQQSSELVESGIFCYSYWDATSNLQKT